MRLVIVLFVATVGLTFALRYFVTPRFGEDVKARFLERAEYIPSQSTLISAKTLAAWLADPATKDARAGYVMPVLFPLDIIFLLTVGLLLGFASTAFADQLPFLSKVPAWIWWVLPALYMIVDVAEDSAVASVLNGAMSLTDSSYLLLSGLKAAKLATVSLAIGQTGFLGLLIILLHFFPGPR